jgi:exopolyphosphatase/guanosine-5'-triphosphate,3'-diphosphate pyrophosphatase
MPGFSDEEQKLLELLVGSYRKKFHPDRFPEFSHSDYEKILVLVVILRLTALLNQRRLDNYLPKFDFSISGRAAKITFPAGWFQERVLVLADLKSEPEIL